jgi:hypothetical protein
MESVNEVGTADPVTDGRVARRPKHAWRRTLHLPSARPADLPSDAGSPRWVPLAIVALAVAFNLWVLRAEVLPVRQLNDSSVHQSMIRWALDRIQGGHLPFDGWYPYLGLGSSLFHHYQSLPHTLTAYLALAIGSDWAFSGTLYILLASWPVSVYLGARLLGWERWPAAGAALISPLVVSIPGYGYEHGSYTWRGLGVWSQLWGMWLLPLAWGFSWRAISGRAKSYGVAALFVGLTCACHFITGYMALLVLPIWVLIKPSQFLKRLGRAAVVGIGGLLIISWVMVPLLLDSKFSTASLYIRNTFWVDSYGARKVFGWLFSGQLFDGSTPSRLPVVSVLVALGAIVCISRWRSDERARALLGALALGLVLFSGRPTFGPLTDLIPGSSDLLLHRFIACVHMAGVLLAGVGIGWIAGVVKRLLPRFEQLPQRIGVSAAVVGVAVLALAPAWSERVTFDDFGRQWLNSQRAADAQEGASMDALIAEAKVLGPGRIFAGSSGGSGHDDRIYSVPIYSYLLSDDADAIGFFLRTTSVSEDVETLFDASNPVDYDIFNVRYVIWPADQRPVVPATIVDTKGGHSLWRVPTSGYLEVVDALPPITADRTNLADHVKSWLKSPLPADGKFPTIAFGGAAGAPATLPPAGPVSGLAGNVDSESDSLQDGVVSGEVTLNRPAMVMLKASFDPRWTVEVDGVQLAPQMVAPSFVGREVPAGSHTVVFRYRPFPRYDVLFALGALVFLGLSISPERWQRLRHSRAVRRKPA